MKKWITTTLTSAVLFGTILSGNAFATQARVQALGGGTNAAPGNFSSLEDDRDIFLFPSQTNTHRDTGFVDMYSLGDANDGSVNPQTNGQNPAAGGIYGFDNGISVGMFVNRDDNGVRTTDFNAFFTSTPTPLENPLDLFASFKRGIVTGGLSLHVANGKDTTETTSDDTSVTTTSGTAADPILGRIFDDSRHKDSSLKKFGFGATVDLGPGPDSYVDVSFLYTSFKSTYETTTHEVTYTPPATAIFDTRDKTLRERAESDGIFSLMARAFLPVGGSTLRFVPSAYIDMQDTTFNRSATDTITHTDTGAGTTTTTLPVATANNPDQPNERTLKESLYGLGLGLNRTTQNNMTAINLTLEKWSMKSKRDVNTGADGVDNSDLKSSGFPVAVNAAFESKIVKPWLVGRIGIKQTIFGKQRSDTRTTTKTAAGGTAIAPEFTTFTPSTGKTEINTPDNDPDFLSIGFGIIKGNFSLDAVVVESNFFSGTYLLSGNKANLLAAISAKLKFK